LGREALTGVHQDIEETAMAKKRKAVPLTKVRIQIPKGASIKDVLGKLEITFEEKAASDVEGQFNENHCCVDVAVVSPVSTVSRK
jgi:hypothetical protein